MSEKAFFQGIPQAEVPWGERTIVAPVFFYDVSTLAVHFLAPVDNVRKLLPSRRMHPIRVLPGRCIVTLAAFEYRECDIGPYNEMSVGIPVTIDQPAPLFTGLLRPAPAEPRVYVRHLPVNTEIARAAGVELAGYPKTLADVRIERDDGWVRCRWTDGDAPVFSLSARTGPGRRVERARMHAINAMDQHLVRVETIFSEREELTGRGASAVRLELGEHPVADEIRSMRLGRVAGYTHAPRHQAVLTPVLESWEA